MSFDINTFIKTTYHLNTLARDKIRVLGHSSNRAQGMHTIFINRQQYQSLHALLKHPFPC